MKATDIPLVVSGIATLILIHSRVLTVVALSHTLRFAGATRKTMGSLRADLNPANLYAYHPVENRRKMGPSDSSRCVSI